MMLVTTKSVWTSEAARASAWCHIVAVVADLRAALDHRIQHADVDDVYLESDCRCLCELMSALADFLEAVCP